MTIEEILALTAGLETGNEFIVIDRLGGDDDNRFAQALRRADGLWVAEYRERTIRGHYQTPVGERRSSSASWSAGPPKRRVGATG